MAIFQLFCRGKFLLEQLTCAFPTLLSSNYPPCIPPEIFQLAATVSQMVHESKRGLHFRRKVFIPMLGVLRPFFSSFELDKVIIKILKLLTVRSSRKDYSRPERTFVTNKILSFLLKS